MQITKEQADRVTVLAVRIAVWLLSDTETKRSLKKDAAEIADIMRGMDDGDSVAWKLVPIEPTNEMITAYLKANTAYWERTDALPQNPTKWRNGTPQEATAVSYRAMIEAATSPQAAPVGHTPNTSNINNLEAKTPNLVTPQAAPAQTEEQEREAFEAAYRSLYPMARMVMEKFEREYGGYTDTIVQVAFMLWKAGRAGRKG